MVNDHKAELERKKQRLAEMRAQKQREDDMRKQHLLRNANFENGSQRVTATQCELREILASVGVSPEPQWKAPEKQNGETSGTESSVTSSQVMVGSRLLNLEISNVQSVVIPVKDTAQYSKTTQTDDERISVGEFSLGSQEFDYDDDMPMDYRGLGRAHSHDLESPNTVDLASILPGFNLGGQFHRQEEVETTKEEPEPPRKSDLTEHEKAQILASREFLTFFQHASTVMERAIAENTDIFVNYAKDKRSEVIASSDRLVEARRFFDNKWTCNRSVTGISFSEQHPELMAVAYDFNRESPSEPTGVVLVWNTKFKKESPEYVFHCQSRLTSVTFAQFHSHLLMAGCYSGQICMWDNRVTNKKTPINKSPLSSSAHTHPVYSLTVIGTHNAHNLVSVSTDGKMCSWNVDNLIQPVEGKELLTRQGKQIPSVCMSFPVADMNNFVVGSEDGYAYALSRHGNTNSSIQESISFDGHNASVSGIAFHRASGTVDFSHLFLTSSSDWTIKLWSTKDPSLRFSFESHKDYVFDVAWSPVHPAVFTSVDAEANLFLWNLNEDTEGPVTKMNLRPEGGFLRKLAWSDNGQQVCVGDDEGNVIVLDVHESMYVLRSEEWTRFYRILADMKQASEEADEMTEVMSRLSTSATSAIPSLTSVGSPRSNWN